MSAAEYTLFVVQVPAKMETLTFTYNEALTPVVTGMTVEGEAVTLSGQKFGTDPSKITVTLERQTTSRDESMREEEEDLKMQPEQEMREDERMDEDDFEDFMDDEMMAMLSSSLDEEAINAIHSEKSRRRLLRKVKLSLADELETSSEGFWGNFTGTGAANFDETVRMGAWRLAGTGLFRHTGDKNIHNTHTRKRRSAEDLPTTYTCTVTAVTNTEASCTSSGLPAGSYTPVVSLDGAGNAVTTGVAAAAAPIVSSMTPTSGSTNGGALLALAGSGFIPGDTSVLVGGVDCPIEEESSSAIACRVAAGTEGAVAVVVKVTGSGDITAPSDFTYSSDFTLTLTSVT